MKGPTTFSLMLLLLLVVVVTPVWSFVPSLPLVLRGVAAPHNTELPATSTSTPTPTPTPSTTDFDVAIIGCGVGGHGAALHSRAQGMSTVVFTGADIGGTCVNRGCVPSKALLAASGRLRTLKHKSHLQALGIQLDPKAVSFSREGMAQHANQLASNVRSNLEASLRAKDCTLVPSKGQLTGKPHEILDTATGQIYTAKNIILAPGSQPFVPPGITVDEQTVLTSNGALTLPSVPEWIAILGSGTIGLEFADIYTALGSEVTLIEALPNLMPNLDRDVAKQAERLLVRDRAVDTRIGVLASKVIPGVPGKKPVTVELVDVKTKLPVETLEVDACMVATGRVPDTQTLGLDHFGITTRRGFVPVNEYMQVLMEEGSQEPIPNLYCIGDANGKLMLAHAASAQGIAAVEHMVGRPEPKVNHAAIPAACFTHPEISMVGPTEEKAAELAEQEGWRLGKSTASFKANSKALAELEGQGMAKVLYNKDTGRLIAVHIIGMHAADLIQECANAVAAGTTVQELSRMVHTHPTLSEVMDEAFKGAVGMSAH
eukprot:Nitzschia sp. Nitz4//scaffold263_size26989//21765//23627//NITZ4_008227-RA/size26989-snap-gene-0.12-mRNA-1//1//CDS//3329544775//8118//frame0